MASGAKKSKYIDSSDDEDLPLLKKLKVDRVNGVSSNSTNGVSSNKLENGIKLEKDLSVKSDSDEDVPLLKRSSLQSNSSARETKVKKERDDEDSPIMKKSASSNSSLVKKEREAHREIKREAKKARKEKKEKIKREAEVELEDDEEDAEDYKWWKDKNNVDDTVKWQTLSHNGVYFAPPYEPLPKQVRLYYDGRPVDLAPEAEEVAGFFAQVLGTDYAVNPVFQKNFFHDLKTILQKFPDSPPIKEFAKCDFSKIHEFYAEQREKRKQMSKEEKELIKQEKLKIEDKYGWAVMDGRREKVGNFRIEIPGLFRGRGSHPKTGCLKKRVVPEQITINIGADAKVPEPPAGHKWGNVIHDNKVTWLAMWKENVNDNTKYVFLGATSSLKGISDLKKFEKARELKKYVSRIRADYTKELRDNLMATRQRATAMYLIDRLALRAGNEKGEDEADTVGCCSLRFEHITLEPPNKVVFDFLGKDSIRYYNVVEVDQQVFKNLKLFKKPPKKEGDPLFDRLTTSSLNKHLSTYMEGLTAKVFRTYNASHTFEQELKQTPQVATVAEKMLAYNRANRQVAILCNHQRSVSKSFGSQMSRMDDRIKAVKYQLREVKKSLLQLDSTLKKKQPEVALPESDLDDEFVRGYEQLLKDKEKEKRQRDLERQNEKRKEEGKPPLKLSEIPARAKATPSLERLQKQFATLTDRLRAMKLQKVDKDENKTTALGTSKTNYIDPRISAAWCKKYNVPIEKIFNKSLRDKFKWAVEVEQDYSF